MESFKTLIQKVKKNPSDFTKHCAFNSDEIFELIRKIEGVKSDVYLNDFTKDLDRIRFSAILSDFTNIFPLDLGDSGSIIINTEATHNFTASSNIISSIVHENSEPIVQAGFMIPEDTKVVSLLKEIEPLIEIERALYSNPRILLGLTKKDDNIVENNTWKIFHVEPSSPTGNWLAMEDSEKSNSLPINFNDSKISTDSELFEITIPYLKGIPFKELAIILKDHEDLLSDFRLNLTKTIDRQNNQRNEKRYC